MSKKSRNIIIVLVAIVVMLIISCVFLFIHSKNSEQQNAALSLDTNAQASASSEAASDDLSSILADKNISFAGIDNIDDGDKTTAINMPNVAENGDILMQFTITDVDSGKQIYQSGLVKSGEYVQYVPGETYDAGTYTFSITESPFYPYNGKNVPLTSGSNAIRVTIK